MQKVKEILKTGTYVNHSDVSMAKQQQQQQQQPQQQQQQRETLNALHIACQKG